MIERNIQVLLAEDDDDHAKLISKHFQRSAVKAEITRVKNGEEVLSYLNDRKSTALPDVLLLDLNMPKVSGIDVLKYVKNEDRYKAIPVVVLTTSSSPEDRMLAYNEYANSYLVKPVDFDSFRDLVQEVGHYWGARNHPAQD